MIYAGVGPRKTISNELEKVKEVAIYMSSLDYTLRSGNALGCDKCFQDFHKGKQEIYLPWKTFNKEHLDSKSNIVMENPHPYSFPIVANLHPNWTNLSDAVRCLLARSVHIILGRDLKTPVDLLLYAKEGVLTGGTKFTVNVAKAYDIPCYNIYTCNIKELIK